MGDIENITPFSVEEAIQASSGLGERAKIIAGGTDLFVQMKKRVARPEVLIFIKDISGLSHIHQNQDGSVGIGALATIESIADCALLKQSFPVIAYAAGTLATPAIRRQATIGGNICNGSPAADMVPALIVMGAEISIQGPEGEKTFLLEDFFKGPGQVQLTPGEIVTQIKINAPRPNSGAAYIKGTRSHGVDCSLVGVAAWIQMDGDVAADAKIALGAVAPTPIRARSAEKALIGQKITADTLEIAAIAASNEASPISDVRCTGEYRRNLTITFTKRVIRQAIEKIRAEV